jgi:4-diphosphocytidyl-2-C-methyl-D-erythritol kinase
VVSAGGRVQVPGVHRALAPAKINLGLFVGPVRDSDGRHELVSVMQSISLADELTLEAAPEGSGEDELLCPGVAGDPQENLAARALRLFRERTGWRAGPVRVSIVKRIPVAAGLGGGSADAAATLRLAAHASGVGGPQLLHELACELGADVPAQLRPGRWLASGAGERLQALAPARAPFGVLVLVLDEGLSTGAVYGEADRLALARPAGELERMHEQLLRAFADGSPLPMSAPPVDASPGGSSPLSADLLHNDLQRAALSLCPRIAEVLERARAAGAQPALVSGSGPTVLGLFAAADVAEAAVARVGDVTPPALWATPVEEGFARVVTV